MKNIALIAPKQAKEEPSYFVSNSLICHKAVSAYDINTVFPLYLYSSEGELDSSSRRPNLDLKIVNDIAARLGLAFVHDHEAPEARSPSGGRSPGIFTPLDLLDYIYAVLHAPSYREKYRELLKIDFPRIPYPKDASSFFALADKGAELRGLHLLESPVLNRPITRYPIEGSNEVSKVEWEGPEEDEPEAAGRVRINADQYFDAVPRKAWDFWIGGYQPARKWLKDRKGRTLSSEDILHWQRITIALVGTARIMGEIDPIYEGN